MNSGGIHNEAGGGAGLAGLEIGNTILKAGASGENIYNDYGGVFSYGYNLSSDDGGGFLTGIGDQINTDPLLGPLQDNGGVTLTHEPLTGSPAINAGDPSFTPPPEYDQRGPGFPRVFNNRLDIGSFEKQLPPLIVATTGDSGAGSLRDTIAAASDGDTIQFASTLNGQTITLTSAELLIDKNIVVSGFGASQLAVKRSTAGSTPAFRIFRISPGHIVTIAGLTIGNGLAQDPTPGNLGGGIYDNDSELAVLNSIIMNNSASEGGGVFIDNAASAGTGALTLVGSTVSDNSASLGGGISSSGHDFGSATLTVRNSTVSGNSASSEGGGIYNVGLDSGTATLTIDSSTFNGNSTAGYGAGIGNYSSNLGNAKLTIGNSTISGNSADLGGGGVLNKGDGGGALLNINYSTIAANSPGPGCSIYNDLDATVHIRNTILIASGGNIFNNSGKISSNGYNLSNDSAGGFLTEMGDQINTNPMLGPLQDNGGLTHTHELLSGSPAINAGDPNTFFLAPPAYDQRGLGFPRIANSRLDIGSFEVQPVVTKLLNISTRLRVLTDDNALIGGFIVTGSAPKRVLIRAIGPSLANLGIPGALADPALELHGHNAFSTITNDNWRDTQESEIEATGIAPTDDLESAIVALLPPGAYTAVVRGNNDGTGVGLVEAYDLESAIDAQLANISTRGFVDAGDNVMIGGFILGNGNNSTRALIRAIGPSLTASGVPGALADPTLELHNGSGDIIAVNDNWKDTQQAEIEATGIPPSDDRESAIVQTLVPGAYTAIVRGKNDTIGVALVEAYQLGSASTPTPSPAQTATPTATPASTPIATPTSTPVATPIPTATVPPTPTATPIVTPTPGGGPARFGSLSSSAMVGIGDAVVLNAFIITGPDSKRVIIRGLGTSLMVPSPLPDPAIDLRSSDGTLIATNDNWMDTQGAEIIATGLPPTNALEAAIVATLDPGSYTVVLRGVNNTTGHGISDLHDLLPSASSNLTAIGTRGNVLAGDDALMSGIVIQQSGGVLMRALGPSLALAGIPGVLADPTLELRDGNGTLLATNDNWRDDPAQEALILATGIPPNNDLEAAVVANLPPGFYTGVARGKNNATGIGYLQFYSLPHSGPLLKLTP